MTGPPNASPQNTASDPNTDRPSRRPNPWALLAVPLVIVLLIIWGILPRIHARRELATDTQRHQATTVVVISPIKGEPAQEIVLPGNIRAFMDAPIYARTNGYLRRWYVDIGAHVHKGQVLADIETPETDQQLAQARADLASAQANANLAQTTSTRYQNLLQSNSVSKQETDTAMAAAHAQSATVLSAQANVQRLAEVQGFQKIVAPFDGVITARNVDVGYLINSGAGSPATELFHIAAVNTLRVFVNLPQTYSSEVKVGMPATVTLAEMKDRGFSGKLVRTADAIDPATRTLLIEVDIDNRAGQLLAGSYAEVHFNIRSQAPALILPVTALLFRSEGLRVAEVDADDRAQLVPVTLGRDYGTRVQVLTGLAPDARVIDSPPDSLVGGEQVRIVKAQAPAMAGSNK